MRHKDSGRPRHGYSRGRVPPSSASALPVQPSAPGPVGRPAARRTRTAPDVDAPPLVDALLQKILRRLLLTVIIFPFIALFFLYERGHYTAVGWVFGFFGVIGAIVVFSIRRLNTKRAADEAVRAERRARAEDRHARRHAGE